MSKVVLYHGYTITLYPVHESEETSATHIVISGEEKGIHFPGYIG